jgi:hypothetical protein
VPEAEWLAWTDPQKMLACLRFRCGVRKLRLFTAAGLRLVGQWLEKVIESQERLADDRERIAAQGLRAAKTDADAAMRAAWYMIRAAPGDSAAHAAFLRDIFGPLAFRRVSLDPALLAWNNGIVVRLAQAAYDERHLPEGTLDNGRLAVLSDALEEAGCSDADILGHLRGPGPHVRGCWAVDLLLGKG